MRSGFGDLIRSWRQAAGLSLREVAPHLGISIMYLSDLERNRRSPLHADRIEQLAAFLKRSDAEAEEAIGLAAADTDRLSLPGDPLTRRLLVTLSRRLEKRRPDNKKLEAILKLA